MKQLFNFLIQGAVIGRPEYGHTNAGGRAFVKFRLLHRTGYRQNGKWVPTAPMEFEVTCWDEQHLLLARGLKPGAEVLVEAKKLVPYSDNTSGDPVMNINPASIVVLHPGANAPSVPAAPARPVRQQRSGDLVVTAHGEKIHADAWPDTVVDLDLVHHG